MADPPPIADPERALVLAYAPAEARPALAALWQLDERFGSVVGTTAEGMIGRIRLAWWREALEALDGGTIPPEPLLAEIAATILPRGISGAELAEMEPGWSALLDSPPDLTRHAQRRGGLLFTLAARILAADAPQVESAGEGWALADLAHRLSDPADRQKARLMAARRLAPGPRWPRRLRPLGALARLARDDAASETRAQGSPRRVLRILAHRLTGR